MAHLFTPRTGWQSEHLGLFILSKFAFCANPVTVSDDLGSDFFCCLFDVQRIKGQKAVVPLSSFAIQIKSSQGLVDVSNKISYLADLELPFFVGVVDKRRLRLTLYSGEYLPLLFSELGCPTRLCIKPVNRRQVSVGRYYERYGPSKYRVLFPLVAHIRADVSQASIRRVVRNLRDLCRRVHGNISTRRTDEHIYSIPGPKKYYLMAGPGSVKVFRVNFYKRLAEALYNFEWLLRSRPKRFKLREARMYRGFVSQLESQGVVLPGYLTKRDRSLYRRMREHDV
jgi:hypothetical protein